MRQSEFKTKASNIFLKENGETSHKNNKSTKLDGKVARRELLTKTIADLSLKTFSTRFITSTATLFL